MICPVCGVGPTKDLTDGLRGCGACDHIYQYPPTIKAVYDQKYASKYTEYPTTEAMSHLRLGLLKSHVLEGSLLDVGYGNGSFVKTALKGGFDAYGCDVHGADFGVREVPLTEKRRWDVVTFFDALEHFEDLDVIRRLIPYVGVFLISLPNRPARFPVDRNWKHYKPGEHLHYFSLESIQRLFVGKKAIFATNAEDTIRGKDPSGCDNILTVMLA